MPRLSIALTIWDRVSQQPRSSADAGGLPSDLVSCACICLASAGFIANRRDLLLQTTSPDSLSDGELLARVFDACGPDAAREICGPFAWIVWDRRARRLIAARDRVGVQGLFYRIDGQRILLAGDIGRLIDQVRPAVRCNAGAAVAHLHARAPARGETFYEGIVAVEPGEILQVDRANLRTSSYWQIAPRPTLRLASDEAYAERFRRHLFEVVSDYSSPGAMAVTLSGGLDSTAVAAAFRATSPSSELKALRWTSPEVPEADEDRLSAAVCRHLGCADDLILRADRWSPLSSPAGLTTSRMAPQLTYFREVWEETLHLASECGMSRVLTGISGDNLFGGHLPAYADLFFSGRWSSLIKQLRQHTHAGGFGAWSVILRRLLFVPLARAVLPTWGLRRRRPVPWLGRRYRQAWKPQFEPAKVGCWLPGRQARSQMMSERQLPLTVLLQNEQAARHGIELRHPFLDHRMFELAASLPSDQTYRAGWTKHVQRLAMRGLLPREVLTLPAKIHPAAICYRSLREQYSAKVWELLRNMRAADLGFVDERKLRVAYGDFLAGRTDSTDFWPALTLEAWLRQHFD